MDPFEDNVLIPLLLLLLLLERNPLPKEGIRLRKDVATEDDLGEDETEPLALLLLLLLLLVLLQR